MKCDNIIEELSAYLDDALDPALRQELEEHLKKCKKCRLVVDTCKKTIQIFCNSEPVPLPDETRMRLHSALRERLEQMRR
ncbi:MAG TPA: zf-HC2 domain-containing protein [Candidatus Acidoferrales bacterium]|nr:zf-HC2 domain-containing protein [Candidatus Acidoferrales bacterium]